MRGRVHSSSRGLKRRQTGPASFPLERLVRARPTPYPGTRGVERHRQGLRSRVRAGQHLRIVCSSVVISLTISHRRIYIGDPSISIFAWTSLADRETLLYEQRSEVNSATLHQPFPGVAIVLTYGNCAVLRRRRSPGPIGCLQIAVTVLPLNTQGMGVQVRPTSCDLLARSNAETFRFQRIDETVRPYNSAQRSPDRRQSIGPHANFYYP
jgi:hypothetical protein